MKNRMVWILMSVAVFCAGCGNVGQETQAQDSSVEIVVESAKEAESAQQELQNTETNEKPELPEEKQESGDEQETDETSESAEQELDPITLDYEHLIDEQTASDMAYHYLCDEMGFANPEFVPVGLSSNMAFYLFQLYNLISDGDDGDFHCTTIEHIAVSLDGKRIVCRRRDENDLYDKLMKSPVATGMEKVKNVEAYSVWNGEAEAVLKPASENFAAAYIQTMQEQYNKWEEYAAGLTYDLVFFDEDDVPELVVGQNGYWVSMYTQANGEVYCVMDGWGYGAFGNCGYEYLPGKNVLYNLDNDYAGLVNKIFYGKIGETHGIESYYERDLYVYNFDDLDGDGWPGPEDRLPGGEDDEEVEGACYYGNEKISDREFDKMMIDGDYEMIEGKMSAAEMIAELLKNY